VHIALCDDSREDAQHLRALMDKYAAEHRKNLQVTAFSSAAALLEAMTAGGFQCYFLDIMMPGMNGIDLAEEIRRADEDAEIVFLSSFNDFAHQSYRVHAYDYLLKPAQEQEIFDLLERLTVRKGEMEDCITLQNGRSVFRIPCDQLAWVEVNQKQLYFSLSGGHIRHIPGKMADMEKLLLGRRDFIKIHRSYIVGLRHVAVLSPEGCEMTLGQTLPVSRLMYKQVRKAYMDYLFGREV